MTPIELEQLILLSDPSTTTSNEDQSRAISLLNSLRTSPEAPHLCLDLLQHTSREQTQFFALATIQSQISLLQPPQRIQLREMLFHLVDTMDLPTYLRTKIGIVFALLIQIDFPSEWENAFEEILARLYRNCTTSWKKRDVLLRILDGISDEIVDAGGGVAEKNVFLKDVMRGYCDVNGNALSASSSPRPESTITGKLMEVMAEMVLRRDEESSSSGSGHHLNTMAMATMKRYCSWIDLSLLIHPSMLDIFYSSIKNASPENEHANSLATKATECLREIFSRGMSEEKKIQLVVDVQLLQNLIHIKNISNGAIWNDDTDIDLAIQIAELINGIGIELFACWDLFLKQHDTDELRRQQTSQILYQYMPLFFICFSYDDIDVSGAVIPAACRMTVSLSKERHQPPLFTISPHYSTLLSTLYNQMKYPADFQFNYEDEDEVDAEEALYRHELYKLFQKLVKVRPEHTLEFIQQNVISSLPLPLSTTPTSQLEAALRLLYHYCEGLKKTTVIPSELKQMIIALHESDIANHYHFEVLNLYYDLAVRYHAILKERRDLLQRVLEAMSSSKGLQHSHPRVRSRSCYLLLRLVKSMGGEVMRVYVETAVEGIQGLLSNPTTLPLRPEDSLYLFETIGLLLGTTKLPPLQQQQYLTAVISPHIQFIQNTLQTTQNIDPDQTTASLGNCIAAIAYLSKGFSKTCPETQLVLAQTIPTAMAVLSFLPQSDEIRSKVMILLQRFILCIGHQILPHMNSFLPLLIQHSNSEDILDVSHLLKQLCIRFRAEAMDVLDSVLLPFLQQCRILVPPDNVEETTAAAAASHVLAERISIQKMYCLVLQHVVSYDLAPVLISERNQKALEKVLRSMKSGAVSPRDDPIMKKTCLHFFRDLFARWGGEVVETRNVPNAEEIRSSFLKFVFAELIPELLSCILHPEFNAKDAMQARNVSEMGAFLCLVKKERCVEFEEWVVNGVLVRLNCDNGVRGGFGRAGSANEMGECLKVLMERMKVVS